MTKRLWINSSPYGYESARRRGLQEPLRRHPARPLRAAPPRRRADGWLADAPGRRVAAGRLPAPRRAPAGRAGRAAARGPRDALSRAAEGAPPAARLDDALRGVLGRPSRPARIPARPDGQMTDTRVMERDLPHPPAKVWRALTRPELMAEWLLQNDFQP